MRPASAIGLVTTACALSCGAPTAPRPPIASAPRPAISLRPTLTVGAQLRFHLAATLELTIVIGGQSENGRAGFELDDDVEVVAPLQIRERISNAVLHGDGDVARQLASAVAALSNAIVTTTFGSHWEIASSTIDGTQDPGARTLLSKLLPVVSFTALPDRAVAVGDVWRNEQGSGSYTLASVGPCKLGTCAVIRGDGEEPMEPQNGATGTEHVHGEQTVDVATAITFAKALQSTTIGHGEQHGQAFQLLETISVEIARVEP